MKTILATAYAVQPYKNAEYSLDWNFIKQMARFHKVIVITRGKNRIDIENYEQEFPNEVSNVQFLFFDLPPWIRLWKKSVLGSMLYYFIWQLCVVGFIQKRKLSFDIVHNLNFYYDWIPSFLWRLKKPFVWGPIGFQPKIPKQYLKNYSWFVWWQNNLESHRHLVDSHLLV